MMMTAENKEKQNFFWLKTSRGLLVQKKLLWGSLLRCPWPASLPFACAYLRCLMMMIYFARRSISLTNRRRIADGGAEKKYRLLSQFSILTKTFWTKRGKKTKGQSHGKWLNRASGDVGTARNNWNTLKREGYARHLVYSSLFQLTRKSSFNNILSLTLAWKKKTNNRFFFFWHSFN